MCGGTLPFCNRTCDTRSGADFDDTLKSARIFSRIVVVPRVHREVAPAFSFSPVAVLEVELG
jgi:hypothetical protein